MNETGPDRKRRRRPPRRRCRDRRDRRRRPGASRSRPNTPAGRRWHSRKRPQDCSTRRAEVPARHARRRDDVVAGRRAVAWPESLQGRVVARRRRDKHHDQSAAGQHPSRSHPRRLQGTWWQCVRSEDQLGERQCRLGMVQALARQSECTARYGSNTPVSGNCQGRFRARSGSCPTVEASGNEGFPRGYGPGGAFGLILH